MSLTCGRPQEGRIFLWTL